MVRPNLGPAPHKATTKSRHDPAKRQQTAVRRHSVTNRNTATPTAGTRIAPTLLAAVQDIGGISSGLCAACVRAAVDPRIRHIPTCHICVVQRHHSAVRQRNNKFQLGIQIYIRRDDMQDRSIQVHVKDQ